VVVGAKSRFGVTTVSTRAGAAPLGTRHRLIVWTNGAMRSWLLPPAGEATVGRAEDADVHIDSAAASRRHALIHVDGPTVSISDLDSRNSTRVNGERITRQRSLTYGDVITFGDVLAILEEQTDETYIDALSEEQLEISSRVVDRGLIKRRSFRPSSTPRS
jgi:hypothetical protein